MKASNDQPIQPLPEAGKNGVVLLITATLDGNVTIRTPGGDVKLAPEQAERAASDLKECVRVARHVRALTATAPAGLDEQGMIDFLTKAFSETPFEGHRD